MNEFLKNISCLTRDVRKLIYSMLEDTNIGESQASILLYIDQFPGTSQEKVRNFKKVDKAIIAKSVKKLIENNYVYRERDKSDSRAYCLYLTEQGKSVVPKVRQVINLVDNIAIEGISSEELEVFLKVTFKMNKNVSKVLI